VWNVSIGVGGSLRRGFGVCLERERKKEVEEATMTGGCGHLLSTEALSPLPSLSCTSDASSPLLVSLSLVSLCENCRVLSVCSGVWCGLVQRFRKRLTGELDITHPETLVWR
jgi:hypothetical protein